MFGENQVQLRDAPGQGRLVGDVGGYMCDELADNTRDLRRACTYAYGRLPDFFCRSRLCVECKLTLDADVRVINVMWSESALAREIMWSMDLNITLYIMMGLTDMDVADPLSPITLGLILLSACDALLYRLLSKILLGMSVLPEESTTGVGPY